MKYKDAAGKVRFKGAGKKLKETQVYPPRFGRKASVQITSFGVCNTIAWEVCSVFSTNATTPTWPTLVNYDRDDWDDAQPLCKPCFTVTPKPQNRVFWFGGFTFNPRRTPGDRSLPTHFGTKRG